MSPYAFYQFWINRSDAEVPGLLRVFTFRSREEIEELERETAERPAARTAQRALADDVTTLVHGTEELPGWWRPAGRSSARETCGCWMRRPWRRRWPRCRWSPWTLRTCALVVCPRLPT